MVVEKEASVGAHQSGRNSGVIHAGVYYAPGSDKARLCSAGRVSMVEYCREHGIDHAVCGKVVVAADDADRDRLAELERRCAANGVRVEMIGPERLREIEPHVAGVAALHVFDTGIVDYADVCRVARGGDRGGRRRDPPRVRSALGLRHARRGSSSRRRVVTLEAQRVVTCAGLHADEVARAVSGPDGAGGLRVVAFRGEYRELVPYRSHLVRTLVYPVPDPRFPFLGVHLTRGIDGHVHVGPERGARVRARGLRVAPARPAASARHRRRSPGSGGSHEVIGASDSTR